MARNEFVSLSVTEDRLIADKEGVHKKELIENLNEEMNNLKLQRNSGLSPEQFACADALITAINDAIKVIELTWFKHHSSEKQH